MSKLTADELTDHLNCYPGSHHAEQKNNQTVVVELENRYTNIPERVIGLGWTLYHISDRGRRLVFHPDDSKDTEYHAEMNQKEADMHLERNGPTDEEDHQ